MTTTAVQCPKCGGPTWDNRVGKKNPKAPDFKCRDKSCDGVIWPPKGAKAAPAPQSAPEFTSPNAPPDWLVDQERAEQGFVNSVTLADKLQPLFALYQTCLDNAVALAKSRGLPSDTVPAMAATTFIAAKDRGFAA